MNFTPGFWKDKTVLVTGHTGFKGGWLSLWLHNMGAVVHGVSLDPDTKPCFFDAAHVEDVLGMDFRVDVRNGVFVNRVFDECSPDVVFHLAAQPLVRRSYLDPVYTFETNILGTVNVLEAIRNSDSVKDVVMVTTDKVYENREWVYPYRENDVLGAGDPYSTSKACAELVIDCYRRSFLGFRSVSSVRSGNVVGGGDWSVDRLVPDAVKSFMNGDSFVVRNPDSVRPWLYVLDSLCGYLLLAEKQWDDHGKYSRAWNFSPDEESMTVGEIAVELTKLWGGVKICFKKEEEAPHESGLLRLDSSMSRKELGWKPKFAIKETLERTVDWYKAFQNKEDMKKYSLDDIKKYVGG